jgi:hypothetical protein
MALPRDLQLLGNRKTWEHIHELFSLPNVQRKPIVLSGPTGCGKTEGIRSYLKHHGYLCMEVDVTEVCNPKELESTLGKIVIKSRGGKLAMLVDDVENILAFPAFSDVLLKRLKERRTTAHGPLILTCNDIYHKSVKKIRDLIDKDKVLVHVRMYAPKRYNCEQLFTGYPQQWLNHGINKEDNDLRQIKLFLDACSEREAYCKAHGEPFVIDCNLLGSAADRSVTHFNSLDERIKGFNTVDDWLRDTNDPEWMVYSNYPERVSDPRSLAKMADVLSLTDGPSYKSHPYKDEMLGRSIRMFGDPKLTGKLGFETHLQAGKRVDLDMPCDPDTKKPILGSPPPPPPPEPPKRKAKKPKN